LTGSDENAQTVLQGAKKAGKEPEVFLEEIVGNFKKLFADLNISYDQFIRTSDREVHWPGAQQLWLKLVEAGDIYKKEYQGLYCIGHEAFITEKELVDGKCPDHGTVPELVKEENYFFRLSKYTSAIKDKIESNELQIIPDTRKREILALLEEGLQDVSFSRPKTSNVVGIPVPGDDTQVMYVWCDALSNYITALGYGRADDSLFKKFWPGMHVIGKDSLRFHAAFWPAMLISAGVALPKAILVHGMIISGGKKMSKTRGNVIDPVKLLEEYGTDTVRFFLTRHVSPFEDSEITEEALKDSYNANLANGLGNLVARIMKLAADYLPEGIQPASIEPPKNYTQAFENYDVKGAIDEAFRYVQQLDQKITATEPFKVIKTDPEAGKKLIFDLTQELYFIGTLLEPFLPETSKKIKEAVLSNKKPETLFPRKD
jgi:methionyl-tRNA synthetase